MTDQSKIRNFCIIAHIDLSLIHISPMRILFLLAKQFRQLLLVKEYAEEGIPQPVMASRLGVPSFVVKNIAVCAKSYRISELRQAVTDLSLIHI